MLSRNTRLLLVFQQQPEPGPARGAAEQQLPHPAEALRQMLDVLLSALQGRHLLNMHQ
jgi:hypothetical protein